MASKRMFSIQIIDSDLFLDMPMSARLLYYDLCMRADDEGFVGNPKKIMRTTGATNDDMNILIQKKFVLYCDSGIVVVRQWFIHNWIRKERINPTMYQEEKSKLTLNENKEYEAKSEQSEVDAISTPKSIKQIEVKKKYGKYHHVRLTEKQYTHLRELYGDSLDEHVKILDEYCEMYGKSYKNYSLVIQGWVHEKYQKEKSNTKSVKLDSKFYEQKEKKSIEELQAETERLKKQFFS